MEIPKNEISSCKNELTSPDSTRSPIHYLFVPASQVIKKCIEKIGVKSDRSQKMIKYLNKRIKSETVKRIKYRGLLAASNCPSCSKIGESLDIGHDITK